MYSGKCEVLYGDGSVEYMNKYKKGKRAYCESYYVNGQKEQEQVFNKAGQLLKSKGWYEDGTLEHGIELHEKTTDVIDAKSFYPNGETKTSFNTDFHIALIP